MKNYILILMVLFFNINCKEENNKVKSNEILNGKQKVKYPNGKLKAIVNWNNNKRVGESRNYYQNGNIKTFDFFNLSENLIYQRLYNTEGKLIKEMGEINPMMIVNTDKFKKENLLVAKIYVLEPPNTEVKLKIFLAKPGDTIRVNHSANEKVITVNQRITDTSYNQFLVKSYIMDYDKRLKWDQMNIIYLVENSTEEN